MAQVSGPYTIYLGEPGLSRYEKERTKLEPGLEITPKGQSTKAQAVQSQLEGIPKDAQWLRIEDEVPSDEEWTILGSHFTCIKNLEVEAGWNEYLNDRLMPENWPLERLLMSSSCGELTENPHILLGKVQHLIMLLTMGIRFEGPSSSELFEAHQEAIEKRKKDEHHITENGIKITYQPTLVRDWMRAKYNDRSIEISQDAPSVNDDVRVDTDSQIAAANSKSYKLTKLEILENDAMELFIRFYIALPRLAYNLRTLNVRSTNCCDLNDSPETLFAELLSNSIQLETLVLTLGEVFYEEDTLPLIYQFFPKNIRKLRFRGPVSLIHHHEWENWVAKFRDPDFLPNLERLSFVCDMAYDKPSEGGWGRREKRDATENELRQAKEQCERLLTAARGRQNQDSTKLVVTEPFVEKWTAQVAHLDGVNPLWELI